MNILKKFSLKSILFLPKKILSPLWRRWKSLKLWLRIILVIIFLIAAMIGFSNLAKQQQLAANREIVTVTQEDLKKEVIRSGQVELQGVVDVTPPISGVVTQLLVTNGQQVKENQLLFKIKSNATQAEIDQARASYLTAKTAYEAANIAGGVEEWNQFETAKKEMIAIENELKSFAQLFPDRLTVDDKEYQQLKIDESVARRNLDSATLVPNQINNHLETSRATYLAALAAYNASRDGNYASPIAGRIENVGINEGENVIAEVGDKEGTPLFLIVPDGRKTISMQIGPNDAMILQEGQTATVKTEYIKEQIFSARVARIDKVGKNVEGKGLLYRAWLEVDDVDNQLLLGIPVEISLITATRSAVLTVPSEAIRDNQVTLVTGQNQTRLQPIEAGLKANGKTEIISGLQAGDQVLIDHNFTK